MTVKAHIEHAYSPRENVGSRGSGHIVLNEPLTVGRLVRQKGDALCKPAGKFWGLSPGGWKAATCKACLSRAAKLGRLGKVLEIVP